MVLQDLAFQMWPEGLQQSWVQLLGLIKNEQGLVAVLLRLPHLFFQLLLHRIQGAAGDPWEAHSARRTLVRPLLPWGSTCSGLRRARFYPGITKFKLVEVGLAWEREKVRALPALGNRPCSLPSRKRSQN